LVTDEKVEEDVVVGEKRWSEGSGYVIVGKGAQMFIVLEDATQTRLADRSSRGRRASIN
jgi:hypothetical protein